MSEHSKITASHRARAAAIYVRQSTLAQLERNTESTARQYNLVARAEQLGWPRSGIRVIDADLGVSGSALGQREGFESLVAEVALGQVGIILALEASRLARDNAAWYRLLDLAGACDTLVADGDGVYHPGLFNDRLVLGIKGTMAEAELHVLRARLEGGIKNKASRGELRRQGLRWPLQRVAYAGKGGVLPEITWVEPTYHAVHTTLTHPAYAGAYVYGRTRRQRYVAADAHLRARERRLRQDEWEVLITEHHPGFIDWHTFQTNQDRIGGNIRPQPHQPGTGAVREGAALLQGLASCGMCGRKLAVFYRGPAKSTPGDYCNGTGELVDGKGVRHLNVGGQGIDAAVAETFLAALSPGAVQACLAATEQLEAGHDAALNQHHRQVEQALLRRDEGRTPLPGSRSGEPPRGPRPGDRVEHHAAARGRRRGRTGPPATTPTRPTHRHATRHHRRPRRGPQPGMGRADHHRQAPQAAEHPHRRGHHRPTPPPGRALPRRENRRDP